MAMHRRRRAAISQSEIRKRCKLYGPFAAGYRAARYRAAQWDDPETGPPTVPPYNPYLINSANAKAWQQGWESYFEK